MAEETTQRVNKKKKKNERVNDRKIVKNRLKIELCHSVKLSSAGKSIRRLRISILEHPENLFAHLKFLSH